LSTLKEVSTLFTVGLFTRLDLLERGEENESREQEDFSTLLKQHQAASDISPVFPNDASLMAAVEAFATGVANETTDAAVAASQQEAPTDSTGDDILDEQVLQLVREMFVIYMLLVYRNVGRTPVMRALLAAMIRCSPRLIARVTSNNRCHRT